ncbi:MAG: hypothetical protein JXR37_01280 [Kiritimatiellae bacterium]|nr:hypothetical protein [Kiritimatiellia bacterium]
MTPFSRGIALIPVLLAASACSGRAGEQSPLVLASRPNEAGPRSAVAAGKRWHPGHYMLLSRHDVKDADCIRGNPDFRGIMIRIYWRDVEKQKGVYDFHVIREALDYLRADPAGPKYLLVMFMDRVFHRKQQPVPDDMCSPEYEGGWFYYEKKTEKRNKRVSYARLWHPKVNDRLIAVFRAMAREFNGHPNFEGVYTEESALARHDNRFNPDGSPLAYDAERHVGGYHREMLRQMRELKNDFSQCHFIRSINSTFPPPGWSKGWESLREWAQVAYECGFGIGGPDVVPSSGKAKTYRYWDLYRGKMPLTCQVQCPEMQKFNVDELFAFGMDELHLNYFIWLMYDWPAIKKETIIRKIRAEKARIHTGVPANIAGRTGR